MLRNSGTVEARKVKRSERAAGGQRAGFGKERRAEPKAGGLRNRLGRRTKSQRGEKNTGAAKEWLDVALPC